MKQRPGSSRRAVVAAVLLSLAMIVAAATWLRAGASGSARAGEPRLVGRTDSRQLVGFSLVLRLPGERRLQQFIANLSDPHSPSYHRFINAKTFGRRFGVSTAALRATVTLLSANGVQVTAQYPQRTALDVRAPAGVIRRVFRTTLMDYVTARGRRFHQPASKPVVPPQLSQTVAAVAGLDNRYTPIPADVPNGGLRPVDARLAYDIAPLYSRGIQGQGERIGIMSFATFPQSDIDGFSQQYGLPAITPQQPYPSDPGPATRGDGSDEVVLDIETQHGIAPQAQILDYNVASGPGSSGLNTMGNMIDKIVADGQVKIVSDSWGFCEQLWDPSDIQRVEHSIEGAVTAGISIFVATGDSGAYGCQQAQPGDHRLSSQFPASSPGVIAVGGTSLSVGQTGQYLSETPWEGPLELAGGDGGLSVVFRRPSWQQALGVSNQYSSGFRQLPDVSADADTTTGWSIYYQGKPQEWGGTSAAAPFWAAAMALIEQYARQNGLQNLGGDVAPMLYAIASSAQPVPPFHDVTRGTNRYYPATVGWDFATGLGSPDVYNLAQDIVRYLKSHGH